VTERLYYTDCYLREFEAQIVEVRPVSSHFHVYLDRTAFYPTSGGQPFDIGRIGAAPIIDVLDEDERIAHVVETVVPQGAAACEIDWQRRFDHMQQHTGQHLLSAVFEELLACRTVSFHLGSETSTIDLAGADLGPSQVEAVEARANAVVSENRPVNIRFYSSEEAASKGLRKPTERLGEIRVVEIAGVDRSACGGTHVRATGEIGPILLGRLDRVRQTARVEFVSGMRAVRRARADYNALTQAAQVLSAPRENLPSLVRAQLESAKAAERNRQKLESELAVWKGRDLYQSTEPDSRGRRLHSATRVKGTLDSWRLLAQQFAAAGLGAVFLITLEEPPALLLAVSPDLGIHAGDLVKSLVAPLGGRGGGNASLAQASLPEAALSAALDRALEKLRN